MEVLRNKHDANKRGEMLHCGAGPSIMRTAAEPQPTQLFQSGSFVRIGLSRMTDTYKSTVANLIIDCQNTIVHWLMIYHIHSLYVQPLHLMGMKQRYPTLSFWTKSGVSFQMRLTRSCWISLSVRAHMGLHDKNESHSLAVEAAETFFASSSVC